VTSQKEKATSKVGQCPQCRSVNSRIIQEVQPKGSFLYECSKCGFAWVELKEGVLEEETEEE